MAQESSIKWVRVATLARGYRVKWARVDTLFLMNVGKDANSGVPD